MEIRFGQYIIHDNNDNGILDAGVDDISFDDAGTAVASQKSDYANRTGIRFDDEPQAINQLDADKFLRKIGLDVAIQTPIYDLQTLAIDYNWKQAMEFAEAGEIDALQEALLSAQVYSEQVGIGFDLELANEWFAYGAWVCYEKNLNEAEIASKLGNLGTVQEAAQNAKAVCKLVSCDETSLDAYFKYLSYTGRMNSVRQGLESANAIAKTDGRQALKILEAVKEIAASAPNAKLAAKQIKSIAAEAIDSLLKSAQFAVERCNIMNQSDLAEGLLRKAIESTVQFSVEPPKAEIANTQKAIAKCPVVDSGTGGGKIDFYK